jgi:arylsulfatase A-like enzyme
MRLRSWYVGSLGLLLVATACQRDVEPKPNVLLVVADTLRADRVGVYGNPRGLTPFMDSLAQRSFVFRNAFASSCWTNPSIASLFTSRHPWQHAVIAPESVLAAREITLAEVLGDHGYATAGWSANPVLRRGAGWEQGLEIYVIPPFLKIGGLKSPVPARAPTLNRLATDWWQSRASVPSKGTRPGYLYLQYMEPHPPYVPTDEVLRAAARGGTVPDLKTINALTWVADFLKEGDPNRELLEAMYDAAVAAFDRGLADLFAELERVGFLQDAIVIITADHGEGLWNHGQFGHGNSLFDELIRVPLVVVLPGQRTRVDVESVVSLVDVAPTVTDLVGIPRPVSFAGRSFADLLDADPSWSARRIAQRIQSLWMPSRVAYSDLAKSKKATETLIMKNHRRAIMMDSYKLIIGSGGHEEIFDRSRDPRELQDSPVEPSLRQQLRTLLAANSPPADQIVRGETRELDPAHREKLRALGYTE